MRRDRAPIADMTEAARRAMEYLADVDLAAFRVDYEKQDAVIRRLAVLGEAARRLAPEIRDRFPQIDWQGAILTGQIVIRHYDIVDAVSLWTTVKEHLPPLLEKLIAIQADTSW